MADKRNRESSKVLDSYILHAYIFKPIVNELGFNAAVVYGRLFLFTHYGAISCTYANSQIQLDLRCSKSTAIRTIDLLEKKGLIKIFLTSHNRQSIRNITLNKNSPLFPYNFNESKNYTGCQKDTRGINLTLGGYQNDTGEGYQNDTHKQNNKQNINIEGEAAHIHLDLFQASVEKYQSQHPRSPCAKWDAHEAAEVIRNICISSNKTITDLDATVGTALTTWRGVKTAMTADQPKPKRQSYKLEVHDHNSDVRKRVMKTLQKEQDNEALTMAKETEYEEII